jgi:hypothetical protein
MLAAVGVGLPLGIAISALVLGFKHRRIRREEAARSHEKAGAVPDWPWPRIEYRSRWQFLGLPLIHIKFGTGAGEKGRLAMGWPSLLLVSEPVVDDLPLALVHVRRCFAQHGHEPGDLLWLIGITNVVLTVLF